MQLIIKEKNITRINHLVDWLIHMAGYTIVFILVTSLFHTIHIDENHIILWSIIIELLIYALNKTVKPILVTLTIPITGLTLGLFYPFINVFILKLADWLLGKHFEVTNIYIAFIAAILLSIMNFIMEEIIKKIIRTVKKKEAKRHEKHNH
ncbi:MAG: phage holin family protein [Bacilli bacterium]|nr:phage holin family protein [Bacilli bacterium]